jgi:signal transduction histidine kinase/DNA-binding response OmpR family regulator
MKKTKSELLILLTYMILILGSASTIFYAYTHHSELSHAPITQQSDIEGRLTEQKLIIAASSMVLLLSLFLFHRREYVFKYIKVEQQNLKALLNSVDNCPVTGKITNFKETIKGKDDAAIYALMSEMIEEMQESKRLADDANATKSLFLANMSHEIRTPLNGIVGFTKFLKSTRLDEEQLDFVNVIRKSSEDLLGIINDILDISKIESGNVELEELFFSPMEEFENVIETYAANASKKNIDFSLWMEPEFSSMMFKSDPGRIKQVLINLISNAVKFTNKKGTIDILIEKEKQTNDTISVKFSVKDNGIGISEEQKEKVFEAFTQADSSTNRKYGGTGLGLTISSNLVKLLGGALKLKSSVGEGSLFYFTLEMSKKDIKQDYRVKPIKLAIYSPQDVVSKDSDHYLEDYLLSFREFSLLRLQTFEDCMSASASSFDALYIHCDQIKKEDLEKIVRQHKRHSQIILVTKLNRRKNVLDIVPLFSQIFYEPVTFSKVEKSIKIVLENKIEVKPKPKINSKFPQFDNLQALVVEDNPINQKMIKHTLKNIGIESDLAENGKIGFEMRTKRDYDIIFMDIQMPVMSGVESTKAILAYEKEKNLAHIPIIAVTANALKGDRERFLAEGMDEYISKPIDLQKFITILQKFFSTKEVVKSDKTDILLYKQTATEAKIIGAILKKLGYSVDVAKDIDEFTKIMDSNSYHSILLDRVKSDSIHHSVSQKIQSKDIPTLLFVDDKIEVVSKDKEIYTYVTSKVTDFKQIKEQVDHMMDYHDN